MKDTRNLLPEQVSSEGQSIARVIGGSASAPQAPPRGAGGRNDPLLYLSCFNSDNLVDKNKKKEKRNANKKTDKPLRKGDIGWKGDEFTPDNKEYKIMKSLRENIKHWGKVFGVERLFFLTLTFKDNVTCAKEAQKRFNNFNRQFSRLSKVTWLYKGIEPQERGALHFHIIGFHEKDLGGSTFDWDAYKTSGQWFTKGNKGQGYKYVRIYSKSANEHLKEMWEKVRSIAKGSKFERAEFLPVRSANCIGQYVGKYLGKCFASKNNGDWMQGLRRFSYSKKAPQVHGRQFSWLHGKHGKSMPTWREKVAVWAYAKGVRDEEDMVRKYGKTWAIQNKDEINYFGLAWRFDRKNGKQFGYESPSVYPTGHHAPPLKNMEVPGLIRTLSDPFENSENELWDKWIGTKINANSYQEHKRHKERWGRAEKEKQFNERVYR